MDEIMRQIKEKAKYWESMDRNNEENRKKAEKYYKDNIMPLLVAMFKEKYSEVESCNHLILTLGTSYEPIVFSILGLKPKKILILCTPKTRDKVDDVVHFTGIKPSQYQVEEVDSENVLILYKKIKNYYEKHGQPNDIYADFTGGTKVMSAGCAMAASLIGAKAIYIASDYCTQLRKPKPGSERLCYIDNPYEVFGDIKRKEAISLFNNMDYKTAYHIFCQLDDMVPGSKEYEALKYLSLAYDQWDSMKISDAIDSLTRCKDYAEKECRLNNNYVLAKHLGKIEKQIEHLKVLNDMKLGSKNLNKNLMFSNIKYLIITLYQNALRREVQGKYEMSSLLLYRILEMISQSMFWEKGIDTAKVEEEKYKELGADTGILLQKINKIKKKIGERELDALPQEISLLNGYIILGICNDRLMEADNEKQLIGKLKEIKGKVISRNNGIFAHGFQLQSRENYESFKTTVLEYLKKYCYIKCVDMEAILWEAEFLKL